MSLRPRVALVHERFTEPGGSEQVVEHLHAAFGGPVHTTVLDRSVLPPGLRDADVRPSPLTQRLYRGGSSYAHLLPLLPLAMRRTAFDDGLDAVVLSHHAFANRATAALPAGVATVSYVHTPARWIWEPEFLAQEVGGTVGRLGLSTFARLQRRPDRAAAARVTRLVANSSHVARRIERHWGLPSTVVHPPIDIERFRVDPTVPREPFFLYAGRLVPYKRPDLAVDAAVDAGVRLVVAGDGRWLPEITRRAEGHPGVSVLGRVGDDELRSLLQRCTALVFPGEEDFGMVPVEAQACGAPVIALGSGGVLDSVTEHTGVLVGDGVEAMADAMRSFDPSAFDPAAIRHHAERFGPERFAAQMREQVALAMGSSDLPH